MSKKIVQVCLNELKTGDTFQVKYDGREYVIEEFATSPRGNEYCIAVSQKTMYAFYYDKVVYVKKG